MLFLKFRDIQLVEPEDIATITSTNTRRHKAHSSIELRKQMAIACKERIRDLFTISNL